ncbi:MAG TPA: hypothetical protein VKT31_00540 [Solirubrobacteraceae bacterium]|nr:hypothetical protein [Solirubrobacteraceae bacterium]
MGDGSMLFGLLLLHSGLLVTRPGLREWRARQDRPHSRRFWALRVTATGVAIGSVGCVLLWNVADWRPGRVAFGALAVAAIVSLPLLAAAELHAALREDAEGEERRRALGLPPVRPMWHPAGIVLLWAALIALAVSVAFAAEAALAGWGFALSPSGRLIDIGVAIVLLLPARSHIALQKRRRRRRDLEQTARDRRLLEV